LLESQRRLDEAEAIFRRAIELAPRWGVAHYNLGVVLDRLDRPLDAVHCYCAALEHLPDDPCAAKNLASALCRLGNREEAAAAYRRVLSITPGDPFARHLLAAMSGETTSMPPDGYVVQLFDDYAASYTEHMVGE